MLLSALPRPLLLVLVLLSLPVALAAQCPVTVRIPPGAAFESLSEFAEALEAVAPEGAAWMEPQPLSELEGIGPEEVADELWPEGPHFALPWVSRDEEGKTTIVEYPFPDEVERHLSQAVRHLQRGQVREAVG